MSTKIYLVSASFVKIGEVKATLYVGTSINLKLHFSHLLFHLGEI
jgi:hypothetical protein